MKLTCPHCSHKSKIRTSREVTSTTREFYVQCENVQCGHTWKAVMSAVNTLVPSACPNPRVYLPSRLKAVLLDDRQLSLMPAAG